MAQRRSEVTVPMLRAMTLAGWTRSPSVPWMVTTSPISAAGMSVTSIMVTSMEMIPTMGASAPRIRTVPRLPSER